MGYSNEILQSAKQVLSDGRNNALKAAEYKRDRLFDAHPRLRQIDRELYEIGTLTAKAILKSERQISMDDLSANSLRLQREQEDILIRLGLSSDVLEPRYYCAKCHDTGYVELSNRTVVCDCLKQLMSDIACQQLSANLPLESSTFDSFQLGYYSEQPNADGKSPFSRMSKIYDYCLRYADQFSLTSRSILMRGATGLGKTHLSLAIANEVIKNGMSVLYVSAPDILSKLEREHFSYQYHEQEDTFRELMKCDLLILDDLGTEFSTPFTVSAVYNVFNSRILSGKPMIISTNLTMTELLTTYSQRFVSRIIGSCDILEFIGDDIRAKI